MPDDETPEDVKQLLNTLDGMGVRRFHATPRVQPQTVGQHSIGVAFIATYIYGGANKISASVLLACLTHDQEELFTGDIPFHAKQASADLRKVCENMEVHFNPKFLVRRPDICAEAWFIIKLADTLEGMWWTIQFEVGAAVFNNWAKALALMLRNDQFAALPPETRHRVLELQAAINTSYEH